MSRPQATGNLQGRFNVLRTVAEKGGRDTSGWYLEIPKRFVGGFYLHWTPPHFKSRNTVKAGLGTTSYAATRAIDGLIEQYKQQIRAEREYRTQKSKRSVFIVQNPNAPTKQMRDSQEFIGLIQKHGKWGPEQYGSRHDPGFLAIGDMRAGILNMTMREYAQTQMAAIFGRPPASEKELKMMQSQVEAYRQLDKSGGTYPRVTPQW